MKKCIQCATTFKKSNFVCPECGFVPTIINGFTVFAPDFAKNGESFPVEGFSTLYEMEAESFWFRARNRLILWALDKFFPNAMNMLEVGCGTGFALDGVSRHRPDMSIWGCDLFVEGLDFAAERLEKRERLFQTDVQQIPFENEFDIVGAFDVLEHIEEDESALAQICQALVPGGGVLITVPQHPWMWSQVDELSRHERRYTLKKLRRRLERAGFHLVYTTSFVSILLPLMFLGRLRKVNSLQQAANQLRLPRSLNNFLGIFMNLEFHMVTSRFTLPWGGSLMVVGRKAVGLS